MDPIRRFSEPSLRAPVAVMAFEGWNDASEAASGTVAYLIGQYDAEPFAIVDPETFINFEETRPTIVVEDGQAREVSWPATKLYAAEMTDRDHDLVVVVGSEPQLRWQGFAQVITDLLRDLGVKQVVLLGAFLAQTPHTSPVPVMGTADDPQVLIELGVRGANYEGPTGIVGVLGPILREEGFDVMSFWAATPHYLGTNANPKAMLALLEKTAKVLDLSVDASELATVSGDFESRVNAAMSVSTEFTSYVTRLEEAAEEPTTQISPSDAAELISEVEDFLKEI
ncbi:MAG: PAC2 family protein [Acidimicrobiia bacterium]